AAAAVILTIQTKKTTRMRNAPREPSPTAGFLVMVSARHNARLTPPRSSANAHVRVQQRLPQAEAAHCKATYDPDLLDIHDQIPIGVSHTQGTTVYNGKTVTTWGWNINPLGGTKPPNGGNSNGGQATRT
ncbi:hypothetical protein CC77DRAFT_919549, partial [Alternaria alternata]